MKLENALFNWLQIQVVSSARPNDRAAKNTVDFFHEILVEDHGLQDIRVEADDTMYTVRYTEEGKPNEKKYPREVVEQLLHDIENEPKYNQ